jgi:heme exporter protein D
MPKSWLGVVLALLAVACLVTVGQRMAFVRRQLFATVVDQRAVDHRAGDQRAGRV